VGDVQKQRRYDPKGLYQFPRPAHRRTAKIDLYQHVGTCNTLVGPDAIPTEVTVQSLQPNAPEAKLKVISANKPDAGSDRELRMSAVKKEAVDYLNNWQIQEKLGEAVKQLLQKRPDDPIDFICSFLQANKPEELKVQPQKAPPKAPTPNIKAVVPFGKYYESNFKDMQLSSAYTKFPGWRIATPKPASKVPPALRPSVGTWLQAKPKKTALIKAGLPGHVTVAWNLQGLGSPKTSGLDQRCEVERILGNAFMHFNGDLEGEYFPLPRSTSYFARPGGMTEEEERLLNSDGFLFENRDCTGRGIYVNSKRDLAFWVNGDHHIQIISKTEGISSQEAMTKLRLAEGIVSQALKQDGYDFAESVTVEKRFQGMRDPQVCSLDERCEVERVLARAFLELNGEMEGDYFPMPSSDSYPPKPGGMTEEQELALLGDGLVLGTADAIGSGVFSTAKGNLMVLVNGGCHLQIISKPDGSSPQEVSTRAEYIEQALRDAIRQDGYDFA
jgi:hypothetical protein